MTVESLTPITDEKLLEEVKTAIKMDGNNYNDGTITFWINHVKQEILGAGVSADVLGSTLAVGCIARGVDDCWCSHLENYSDMFWTGVYRLKNVRVKEA